MAERIDNKPATKKRGNPNWKKGGPSPNPAGAPKRGMSWREIIDSVGDEVKDGGLYRGLNRKQAVVRSMFDEAGNANTSAAMWLARYGGGESEFSKYSEDQLRELLASRLGIAPSSNGTGHHSQDATEERERADA